MKTIIAAFCDAAATDQAAQLLRSRLQGSGQTSVPSIHTLTYRSAGDDVLRTLSPLHIPDDRAHLYAEIMRRGAALLIAQVPDGEATQLADELDGLGSLDLDSAEERWRKDGWNGYDDKIPFDARACASERRSLEQESMIGHERTLQPQADQMQGQGNLDVVEENVTIGKRHVARGGVRVRTFVVERPVEETVELREEHIDVTREPVDEPLSPEAADSTFVEDEFVVSASGEEAIVGKEARIVERVHVGKSEETRTETIQETERRRDVEVEDLDHQPPARR